MAKDPAFLFYPADFIIGTVFMTHEQKGKYVSLLCYQHQLGPLSEDQMVAVCGNKDEVIFKKFKKNEDGLFYNQRLDNETTKRKEYSQSRSKNRKKDMNDICSTHDEHMVNENRNENIITNNKNITEKIKYSEFVVMTQGQYDQLAQKLGKTILEQYVERLNNYIGSKGKKYKSHYHTILNWSNMDKDAGKLKPPPRAKKANANCWMCKGTGKMGAGSDCSCLI